MSHQFWHSSVLLFIATVGLGLQSTGVHAQAPATLPAGWQEMSADDFAAAIRPLHEEGQFNQLSIADELAAKSYGEKLFLQVDLANSSLSYRTIEMLHWVARYQIDESVVERSRNALAARQDNWAGQPYAEMRAKVAMMNRLHAPDGVMVRQAQRWVQAGGTVDQVPASDMKFGLVRQMFTDIQLVDSSFSVEWSGMLVPTQSGAHQFQISPINVSAGHNPRPVKFAMTVSVGGQVVLNSSPQKENETKAWMDPATTWISQSNAVMLTAGKPVAIQVTASAEVQQALPQGLLHATLFWKTPESNGQAIIPSENLTLTDGSRKGLSATYTWASNGQPQTLTRTDANIDFAWTGRPILLAKDTSSANQSADVMWQALTSKAFLTETAGPPVKTHYFLSNPDESAAALTTPRRAAFLDLLLKNPTLLDVLDAKQSVRFFESFRVGNPDKALDVFGVWASRNPDLLCDFSTDRVFNGDQRYAFASVAIFTTQQLPGQEARLQSEYLQLPDGRCSLPVAYTLACSYLGQKKYADWLALLDAKLAEPAVAGDVRVNWLLARANAQELSPATASHYPHYYGVPYLNPTRSKVYLDQALQAAQSPAVKLRVAREIIGRLTFRQEFESAKAVLQSVDSSLPADQKVMLTEIQQQLDTHIASGLQMAQSRLTMSSQFRRDELKRRRDQATKRGDSAAVSRYDGLIDAADPSR